MKVGSVILALVALIDSSLAQDYDYQEYADGYEQDNLYQDYAMKHQDQGAGRGG